MSQLLMDQVVMTDYGQFDLTWGGDGFDGDWDKFFAGQANGLVGAAEGGGLYVNLGRRSGGSRVRVVVLGAAPAEPDEDWEDVVEVSVYVPADVPAGWCSWAGETRGTLDLPPGGYRVRVSAQGRDAGRADEFAEAVVDSYLIEFWPDDSRPDTILRTTSEDAKYWHGDIGGHR